MIPVLNADQATAWDERARTSARIPSRVLMESAGRGIVQVIARHFGDLLGRGVIVATGPGNNGGDGWVIARALHALGVRVLAAEAGEKHSEDCAANRALALSTGVERLPAEAPWPSSGLVVDALLGTGAVGAPKGAVGQLAQRVAAFGAQIVAVDGPTGLDLTTGQAHGPIRANLTVTFGGVRRGHLISREWCGQLVVIDIGFPPADESWPQLATDRWARAVLPALRVDMHKGDRGRVLVVGGDEGMAGAAIHAARSALVAGAGLVRLAAAEPTVRAAQETLPDALTLVTRLGPDPEPALLHAAEWADALIVGPGIGRGKDRQSFVARLLGSTGKPALIDADALHAGSSSWAPQKGRRILTPHPGEFAVAFPELAKEATRDRFAATVAAAKTSGCIVLLKGVPTVVASPSGHAFVAASGNPALATGGSGDVLAGMIGAFLARSVDPLIAAALGSHAMGRAADRAASEHSARATRPADVLSAVPGLWKRWAEPDAPLDPPVLVTLPVPQLG